MQGRPRPGRGGGVSAHIETMNKKTAKSVNAAAVLVPMAWIAQTEKPTRKQVQASFMEAAELLPDDAGYDVRTVRSGLISVASGTDPRGGTFISQAIRAAAALHDLNARLTAEHLVR